MRHRRHPENQAFDQPVDYPIRDPFEYDHHDATPVVIRWAIGGAMGFMAGFITALLVLV